MDLVTAALVKAVRKDGKPTNEVVAYLAATTRQARGLVWSTGQAWNTGTPNSRRTGSRIAERRSKS